jgi:8-oxo-dGTP pyrophosphatase MutT (NUDIX family)
MNREYFVPIIVDQVFIDDQLQNKDRKKSYYNKVCTGSRTSYICTKPLTYRHNIKRIPYLLDNHYKKISDWPAHPIIDVHYPENRPPATSGAIVFIRSSDNYVLILESNKKWGFPKGSREYRKYQELVQLTARTFNLENIEPVVHESLYIDSSDIESDIENAHREVFEETGIDLDHSYYQKISANCNVGGYTAFILNFPHRADAYYENYLKKNGTDHENDVISWVTYKDLVTMYYKKYPRLNKMSEWFMELLYERGLDLGLSEHMSAHSMK